MIETALNLIGLVLTVVGATIAARAVIISEEQAKTLSSMGYGGVNNTLRDALLRQSRAARNGLLCIVGGALFQILALISPFL